MSADVYWSRPSSRLDRPSWKMAPHLLSGKAAGRSNDRPRPSIKDVRRRAAIFESIFLEHNTRRGDRAGAKAYPSFCERYGLGFEPTPDTLALFLERKPSRERNPPSQLKAVPRRRPPTSRTPLPRVGQSVRDQQSVRPGPSNRRRSG
jgi:hypothetical protein